jgi:Fe-S cluster biogenesis protein NfuA
MTEDVMTIRTERTPNPNSLKYKLGKLILPGGSANFPTVTTAERSPLAKRLFAVSGVTGIFIGSDFFTVTKQEDFLWPAINEGIAPALEEFFESGDPVLQGAQEAPKLEDIGDGDADPQVIEKIKELIETQVRPAVAQDGGDIVYRGYDEGIVYLEMHGACSGCPSSSVTLKQGIETMLQHYLPDDIKEVRAI